MPPQDEENPDAEEEPGRDPVGEDTVEAMEVDEVEKSNEPETETTEQAEVFLISLIRLLIKLMVKI